MALYASPAVQAAQARPGDTITNVASISSAEAPVPVTSEPSIVTLAAPLPARIEFLTYSPSLPDAEPEAVVAGVYRAGTAESDAQSPLPLPRPTGARGALELSAPLPLHLTSFYHQGDPVFVRLFDQNMNRDHGRRESVFVTITDLVTGDSEVVQVTEDATSSGLFVGYVPTARVKGGGSGGSLRQATQTAGGYDVHLYNGLLEVTEKSRLVARYTDPITTVEVVSAAALVDAINRVIDSFSGQLVNGAEVTVVDAATGLPASPLADDGFSSFPSTLVSGQTITDGSGRTQVFGAGEFRFPFLPPGQYKYVVKPPAGYSAPSIVADAVLQTLPGAPFALTAKGSRGEVFALNPGPAAEQIDVPIDPAHVALWVTKTASKDRVGIGDFLSYQINVTNSDTTVTGAGIHAIDTLPVGFKYRNGSTLVNNAAAPDPVVSRDGRVLTFDLGPLAAGGTAAIRFAVSVGPAAPLNQNAINLAQAIGAGGSSSNVARAPVLVGDDFFRSRNVIAGRVTSGPCNERDGVGIDGVEGIRVLLEDGTFVLSDKQGLFHFDGVRNGTHVVQLDLDSLPEGWKAVSCTKNDRFAGRAFSQFVEMSGDALWRADFHLEAPPPPPPPAPPPPPPPPAIPEPPKVQKVVIAPPPTPPGELSVSLAQTAAGLVASIEATVKVARASPMPLSLAIRLPAGVNYKAGSARLDGKPSPDPLIENGTLTWFLGVQGEGAPKLTFQAGTLEGTAPAQGLVEAVASMAAKSTPPAQTALLIALENDSKPIKLVIRPHFAVLSDVLNDTDKAELDKLAKKLTRLHAEKITVIGHTDGDKIKGNGKKLFADNQALSKARAAAVGNYLRSKLHLPEEKLVLDGRGETEPVASNKTRINKALNRRVEVFAQAATKDMKTVLRSVKDKSEESKVEVPGIPLPAPAVIEAALQAAEGAPAAARAVVAAPPISSATAAGAAPSDSAGPAVVAAASAAAPATAVAGAGSSGAPTAVAASASAPAPSTSAQPAASSASAPMKTEAPASTAASAAPAVATARAIAIAEKPAPDGIIWPQDGDLLPDRVSSVQLRAATYLTLALAVDGKPVAADRIGYKRADAATQKTTLTFVGVDFGERGAHVLTLKGTDPFGNVRLDQTFHVTRTGEINSLRFVSAEDNVADGKTPIRARIQLVDSRGDVIPGAARLELREGTLLAPRRAVGDKVTLDDETRVVRVDRDGWVLFAPVNTSGSYRAVLGLGTANVEIELWAKPKMRDWVLVGLAEGTVGYSVANGNLETLTANDGKEDLYADGRVALYAKGQIQGKWLVTMAYDSAKNRSVVGDSLFQIIDPQAYYTLYGDSSQQAYDAASARKIYVKIEREQFYALFGDFDTGLTVTELSRYSRRLNGVKTELQTRNFELNGFGAQTDRAYARDELQGDGTSGLYRLSRKLLTANSEVITLVTRDRFHNERIVSSKTMVRFIDYSIDYEAGTLFFREPILSRDDQLNPNIIVIEYETQALATQDFTVGGRAGVKLLDNRVKVGATVVHEGQGDRQSDVIGGDVRLQLTPGTRLRGEYAVTDTREAGETRIGQAYLAELTHTMKMLDIKIYARQQQSNFGLGQTAGSEAGTRKEGVEAAARFTDLLGASGQLYRQDTFSTGTQRTAGDARLTYTLPQYSAYVGVLEASDKLLDGSSQASGQLTAGGKVLLLENRLTLGLDYAQSIWGNANADFPTRIAGRAEYKLTETVALLGAQELTFGDHATTSDTRVGLRTTLWKGGSILTSMEDQLNENASRLFGNLGLKQTWQLSEAWHIDAGGERSQTVRRSGFYSANPAVPAAVGTATEDFSAASLGATYQIKSFLWDARAEGRTSTSEDRFALLSGLVAELGSGWALSGKGQLLGTSASDGSHGTSLNVRFGAVYRPAVTRWIFLNRLDWLLDRRFGTAADLDSGRLMDNFNANFRPQKELQISLGYGVKYSRERIEGALYRGVTDQVSAEGRYDLTTYLDVGLRGSVLHGWADGSVAYSAGPSVGVSPVTNVWVSLGVNLVGYNDRDFSAANYTAAGPYIKMRLKFDQESVKEAAAWINKQ